MKQQQHSSINLCNIYITLFITIILLFNMCICARETRFNGNGGIIRREKQPREVRGFQSQLTVARGFGKRANTFDRETTQYVTQPDGVTGTGTVAGNINDPLEFVRASQINSIESMADKMQDSFPIDWFVEAMQNNPMLARTLIHKFVDVNGDGLLSAEELLRPAVF
ncbi:allatotropins-like [Chrysoperla carnea]|uniref:allatotropins-like n=1 Tax=Chrysoperla carnea TaxID=189513 RepID=UPI001D0759A8|nr:allatotropins-like [Chrysoperla carnea]